MTPERTAFFERELVPLETMLLVHPLGGLFTGELYDDDGDPISGLELPDMGPEGLVLSSADMGRLFMAPDESNVSVLRLREQTDEHLPASMWYRAIHLCRRVKMSQSSLT